MRQDDLSMTPYFFYTQAFEKQMETATMRLLNEFEFFRHPMEQQRKLLLAADERFLLLEEELLRLGGDRLAYCSEPHLDILCERGESFGARSISDKMETSRCHTNVAELWRHHAYEGGDTRFRIYVGWALSKDGIWRQHTFGRWDAKKTIETTEKRTKYFGSPLTAEESYAFCIANLPGFKEGEV